MITKSGRFRDSVYFSIIDSEWRAVKTRLISMLASAGISSPPAETNELKSQGV
jgi:hypothetical protein